MAPLYCKAFHSLFFGLLKMYSMWFAMICSSSEVRYQLPCYPMWTDLMPCHKNEKKSYKEWRGHGRFYDRTLRVALLPYTFTILSIKCFLVFFSLQLFSIITIFFFCSVCVSLCPLGQCSQFTSKPSSHLNLQ